MMRHVSPDMQRIVALRKSEFQRLILSWARRNLRDFPWRRNPTPYTILITEVLLRRTTASAVLRIYPLFMKQYGDPKRIAATSENELASVLSTIGYHKRRARILKEITTYIAEKFNGIVPCTRESLLEIPHVGSYTAGAILSFAFDQPFAIVDTNIERVYGRIFVSHLPPKGRRGLIEQIASSYAQLDKHQTLNLALLDLAALVCTYGVPKCEKCPLQGLCDYSSLDNSIADRAT
jgi:A/G-specific adenine glycosylase